MDEPKWELVSEWEPGRSEAISPFVRRTLKRLGILNEELGEAKWFLACKKEECRHKEKAKQESRAMNGTTQNGGMQSGMQSYRWTEAMPATILLVADEPAVRMGTREALELGGYHVLEADGPQTATRIAGEAATAIDLLLTDMMMPGMNGAELARRVRESRPELQTLFMTGYTECEALRLAMLDVKHRHIQKPFTVSNLLARVADALAEGSNGDKGLQAPQYPSP